MAITFIEKVSKMLQLWPFTFYQFAILFSLINMNLLGIYFTVIGFVLSAGINNGLKYIFNFFVDKYTLVDLSKIIKRPTNIPSIGCDFFDDCGYIDRLKNKKIPGNKQTYLEAFERAYKNKPNFEGWLRDNWIEYGPSGMPSGHAQSSIMFAVFWSLYLYEKYSTSKSLTEKIFMWIGIGTLFAIAFAVCFQRVLINCHNPYQILLGCIIGYGLGYGLYKLVKFIMYYSTNEETYKNIYQHSISLFRFGLVSIIVLVIIVVMFVTLKIINKNEYKYE